MRRRAITAADFLNRAQAEDEFAHRHRRYGPPQTIQYGFLCQLPQDGEPPKADDPLRRMRWYVPDEEHFDAWARDYTLALERGELNEFLADPASYMESLEAMAPNSARR